MLAEFQIVFFLFCGFVLVCRVNGHIPGLFCLWIDTYYIIKLLMDTIERETTGSTTLWFRLYSYVRYILILCFFFNNFHLCSKYKRIISGWWITVPYAGSSSMYVTYVFYISAFSVGVVFICFSYFNIHFRPCSLIHAVIILVYITSIHTFNICCSNYANRMCEREM